MREKHERPTEEQYKGAIKVAIYYDWPGCLGTIERQLKLHYPDAPKPRWTAETVEKFRAWMREFDRVIRDGVEEGWEEGSPWPDDCIETSCLGCPVDGGTCWGINSDAGVRMEAALSNRVKWGENHLRERIIARRAELRKYLESVGLDWETPEPIWKAIARFGEEAAKEHEPEAEKETCEGCAFVVEPLGIEMARQKSLCLFQNNLVSAADCNAGCWAKRPAVPPSIGEETCEGCAFLVKVPEIDEQPTTPTCSFVNPINPFNLAQFNKGCKNKRPAATRRGGN